MRNSGPTIEVLDTQNVPQGEESVLEAELKAAREILAARESYEKREGGVRVPESVYSPRLSALSTEQLEDHIERLERDLQLAEWNWGGGE